MMSAVALALLVVILGELSSPSLGWKLTQGSKSARNAFGVVLASGVMAAQPALADAPAMSPSLQAVARVYYSLNLVNKDTIQKSAEVSQVRSQIKLLQYNYRLKDNLEKGLKEMPKGKKEDARQHLNSAIEYLALIDEYFDDGIG